MKKHLLTSALSLFIFSFFSPAWAQSDLAPDQNPSFAVSRDKYLLIADSINQWHGATFQETYKAYDWYEQKQQRREDRRSFHRQVRLERAQNYYRQPYYHNYYNRRSYQPWPFFWF